MIPSILKMLEEDNHNDRVISKYPVPFMRNCTPYWEEDFSDVTKDICKCGSGDFLSSLKISKVIILGDLAVGKTCIVNRFCHQKFESGYKATIGVDFEVERFDILNFPFHLQIWDTAGQERFKCIAQSYYRSAHAIIVVFDFTNISTLSHCKQWLKEALNASGNEDPFIFLVGTKKDLVSQATYENIEVSAVRIAHHLLAEYWSVSSKTQENINKLFLRVAALTFNKCVFKEKERSDIIIESELISIKRNKSKSVSNNGIICNGRKCRNI